MSQPGRGLGGEAVSRGGRPSLLFHRLLPLLLLPRAPTTGCSQTPT